MKIYRKGKNLRRMDNDNNTDIAKELKIENGRNLEERNRPDNN